ncbi:Uncharacterized protein TCM_043679 [Theobroma cacao]|uniref:Uncharacterized protein n=1 Tax=Theobroma cacao TaxID=3641 RepID=A0A061FQU4_THECC|nr:Uncharacterized protein TCM_043679 [Theobroma cacao]
MGKKLKKMLKKKLWLKNLLKIQKKNHNLPPHLHHIFLNVFKSKNVQTIPKFLEVFKKLHINIPFAEALEQMPSYLKFLKEILTKKRKLEEFETVALIEECSAIIQNKLPPKLKDPGSFSIPCTIGSFKISKALCDLGASVSIMPLSIARKLGFQEIQPTTVTLQLADRTIRHPNGIIEDVLLKVGHLYIPVDFIVLEIEDDVEIPLILGRPFLATARALIDVKNGKITFRVERRKWYLICSMQLNIPIQIVAINWI